MAIINKIKDIANAIRSINGETTTYKMSQMPEKIKEFVKPNTITIGDINIINQGFNSIEVSCDFDSDVDFYTGISILDNEEDVDDSSLLKNTHYLERSFYDLEYDKDYWIRGVGLPIMGNLMKGNAFKFHTESHVCTLSLSVSPENSGIVTGAGTYASDELVRVTATPNTSRLWEFDRWSDGVLSNIRDVYMDSNKNLTAIFKNGIPEGYKMVKYLESTGTQYIRLPFNPSTYDSYGYILDFKFINTTADQSFIGGVSSNGSAFGQTFMQNNNIYLYSVPRWTRFDGYAYTNERLLRNVSINKTAIQCVDKNTNGDIVRQTSNTYSTTLPWYNNQNIGVFCFLNGNTPQQHTIGILYGLSLIGNDTNINIYVPLVRESDNKPGLYDRITGQFLTNQGTGEFIVGPDL